MVMTADNAASLALDQDPHGGERPRKGLLEWSIGRATRQFRDEAGLTIHDLSKASGVSAGMLSRIENGSTSPSLATLQALTTTLNVPLTALFRGYERARDATFVKGGQGLKIERRGTRAGHQYELLGHAPDGPVVVEPYVITLDTASDVFPVFQHAGLELIYILEGAMDYRHGDQIHRMEPGDALFFDADAPHGPEALITLPIRFLSVISYARAG